MSDQPTRPRLVKVVRDRINEYLPGDDQEVEYKPIKDDAVFQAELKKKLGEELAEYLLSGDVQELADLMAVAQAVAIHCHKMTFAQLAGIAADKQISHGGFANKIGMYVTTTEEA